ncbi:glycosyltransferase [Bergeyella zoohelcum]|uniref:glycosyltransferase n=1 Tax=Bergeyella zoohelcum TaxID=1015 RepID=UPI002A90A9FF|nr:glycosyltransferase [Bergeyella zoohelcum]MDY6025502.1 glycosyltransferase [Bergeyella zoohelcum]
MKKAVFFVSHLDSGGIENYLLRFLKYKADAFSEIVVFCKNGKDGQLDKGYLQIPNVRLKKQRLSFFNPLHYMKLIQYFKDEQFDVVCDFTGNFAGLVLWSAKQAKIKNRIAFYRGATDHFNQSFLKIKYNNFEKKMVLGNATHILSNSQAAFDYFFKGKKDDRFQVIYNGIDVYKFEIGNENLREEFNIPDSAFVIGHTGRLNEAKNHPTILKVAEKLIKKHQDIYFILCGNNVKNGLEQKVKELGIFDKVLLFENRRDIPLFLNTMDAYFFPSITEGQPNALIEAMIMGLPFVASDIAPIKETVLEQDNLYNTWDEEGFIKALEQLYFCGKKRNEETKVKIREKFNHKERFEEFYRKLI